MTMQQTPSGDRLHIGIFGRRNAGKSSLINAVTAQPLAIVSDIPGTTTDPVSKAMEILPLGPVLVTDTAGLDDEGPLGELRVARTLQVLDRTDLGLLVVQAGQRPGACEQQWVAHARERQTSILVVVNKIDLIPDTSEAHKWAQGHGLRCVDVSARTGEGIEQLKGALAAAAPSTFAEPTILGDLVSPGDIVVMVVPIDKAAPKGRLILPQVMTIRDVLDNDAMAMVVKERELRHCLARLSGPPKLVVTDSQAFLKVAADTPREVWMTSFSILMARYKGDLVGFVQGTHAMLGLHTGSRVMIAEGCTHHRQGDDIGTVQIPRWLRQKVGGELDFHFCSGQDFPDDLSGFDLIVHCGSCMLNRRQLVHRQKQAQAAGVPMTNYGLCLAEVHGILDRALEPFPAARLAWKPPSRTAVAGQLHRARVAGG